MLRLELTFLHSANGDGCNVRGRGSKPAPVSPRFRPVGSYGHSESSANLLMHIGPNCADYSECVLISLKVLPDFDSTIRRFESSRPSHGILKFL